MISERLVVLLDVGPAPSDSLKSTCMNLLGVEGETECAATTRGEPAPAQHITRRCLGFPRELKLSPRKYMGIDSRLISGEKS